MAWSAGWGESIASDNKPAVSMPSPGSDFPPIGAFRATLINGLARMRSGREGVRFAGNLQSPRRPQSRRQ